MKSTTGNHQDHMPGAQPDYVPEQCDDGIPDWCTPQLMLAACFALAAASLIWTVPETLTIDGKITLTVMVFAIIGWTMTQLGDTTVAVLAALTLSVSGVIKSQDVYATLGHELIWLILAAFVMSAVLRASGLVERSLIFVAARVATVSQLFYAMTGLIAVTAFFIPSTSGRAALLLPVFIVLADELRKKPYVRALALLFPTIILLSASGSLIGAGAHLIAAEIVAAKTGYSIGYLQWAMLAAPIAILSSLAATTVILRTFLSAKLRAKAFRPAFKIAAPMSACEYRISAILLATVCLWIAEPLHGIDTGLVALGGCIAMLHAGRSLVKSKDAFKSVETELLVFLALTFVLAKALTQSGVDVWMAEAVFSSLPAASTASSVMTLGIVAIVALLAHLVITSRTARASVLVPAFVLPLAAMGHDTVVLVLVTVVGTGFCQTMTSSSKAVALFSRADRETYAAPELLRLSGILFPVMFALLMVFGLAVWPHYSLV